MSNPYHRPAPKKERRREPKQQEDKALLTDMERRALRALMDTPEGRRIVYWLAYKIAKVDDGTTFTGNSNSFYLEGRRSVGVDLLQVLRKHTFRQYVKMTEEALHEQLLAHEREELRRLEDEDA